MTKEADIPCQDTIRTFQRQYLVTLTTGSANPNLLSAVHRYKRRGLTVRSWLAES